MAAFRNTALFLIAGTLFVGTYQMVAAEKPMLQTIHSKVIDTIKNTDEIPGLKADEFQVLREDICKTMTTLVDKSSIVVEGRDQDVRPTFVALQGVVEHVLSHELKKSVGSLVGIIHTPMPATPLCTLGEISPGILDPTIANDPKRKFTVQARTTIVRNFLHQGGMFVIAYPKAGMEKRSATQQLIYKQELSNYPSNLIDRPLKCDSIPDDLIGATYFFTDQSNRPYIFAIKMRQANDPKEKGSFGLWLGPADHSDVAQRASSVMQFVNAHTPK